jgi:hypothetical protein
METITELDGQIARLTAEIGRLREQKRQWMRLADERAIEVGTLKTELKRLQRALETREDVIS